MALSENQLRAIARQARAFWDAQVSNKGFLEITRGKEIGHRIADYVDDHTTALLKVKFDTRYEADGKGESRKRSMGDVWLHGGGVLNPVNVKAGLQDMNGQPNLVSMQKLLDYILHRWIDSYYLLIVKFSLGDPVQHKIALVDMLDWLDFIVYDAGPGQIMLRERDFFLAWDSGNKPRVRTMVEKVELLFGRFEAGVDSLICNRKELLRRQRKLFEDFGDRKFEVDQSGLVFVP